MVLNWMVRFSDRDTMAESAVIHIADSAATPFTVRSWSLMCDRVLVCQVWDVIGKQDVEEWTKNVSLRHTTFYWQRGRQTPINTN